MKLNSVNKVDKNIVAFEVTVGAEEFKPVVEAVYRKHAANINLPGFRPGKAPKAMVFKNYGPAFVEEAVNTLYPRVYEDAVVEAGITPVDSADVEIFEVSEEGFSFKATVTVKPEVEVKKYKGVSATKKAPQVEDNAVEDTLEQLRNRAARLVTVEDRASQMGDTTNINFEGFSDGVPFDGGKGEDFDLVLGSGQFIPGFEEQVVGKSVGEEFDVNVSFPESYHAADLAGKAVVFKCKLNALKAKELPELDDEFAKDISEFDTLDELKADIMSTLMERAEKQCQDEFENELVTAVLENTEIDLPQCMVDRRVDELVSDFDYRLRAQGMDLATYIQYTGETMQSFRRPFEPQAERHVRIRLALEKIAELENITATDEEVEGEYERLAGMYNMDSKEIKNVILWGDVYTDTVVNKAIDLIRENAEVKSEDAAEPAKKRATKKAAKKDEAEEGSEEAPKKRTRKTKQAAEEDAE